MYSLENPSPQNSNDQTDSLALAERAATGEPAARKIINDIVHPMIAYQSSRFCKQFCQNHKYQYVCTLTNPWGNPPSGAALCEWGNASYGWMLDDLTSPERLRKFEGRQQARINDYLYRIANSLPFYERWKEWRLGKRLHVPTWIQSLHDDAAHVFTGLYQQNTATQIAQKYSLDESLVTSLTDRIIILLTQRNRLHLLDPPRTVSLSSMASHSDEDDIPLQADIPWLDKSAEENDDAEKLNRAWQQLSAVEQFVLEAMLLDEQDANDVLAALGKLDIEICNGVPPDQTSRQQLYYFRRKSLAKLSELSGLASENNL
jgi:hypothetical protein